MVLVAASYVSPLLLLFYLGLASSFCPIRVFTIHRSVIAAARLSYVRQRSQRRTIAIGRLRIILVYEYHLRDLDHGW